MRKAIVPIATGVLAISVVAMAVMLRVQQHTNSRCLALVTTQNETITTQNDALTKQNGALAAANQAMKNAQTTMIDQGEAIKRLVAALKERR